MHKLPLDRETRYRLGFKLASIRGSGDGIDALTDAELLEALRHEDKTVGRKEELSLSQLSERLAKLLQEHEDITEKEIERARHELAHELRRS